MQRWRLTVEYDGTAFVGWQSQPQGRSVQGVLEAALKRLLGGEPIRVMASGRTDAGVHARAQVVSFAAETPRSAVQMLRGLNQLLPEDVGVQLAEPAEPSFHALRDARFKVYRYRLRAAAPRSPLRDRYCWRLPHSLSRSRIEEGMRHFTGHHHFESFRAAHCSAASSDREILWTRALAWEDELQLFFCGRGFLRHMVRIMVGSLVEVGRGRHPPDWIQELLMRRDRSLAGPTAPPSGLCLMEVSYDQSPLPPEQAQAS